MRLFLRCNQDGRITSAMKVSTMDEALVHPYGSLPEGEVVIEVEPPNEVNDIECHEIVALYSVDLKKKKLQKLEKQSPGKPVKKPVKKSAKKSRRGPRA